jgi:hypothetical protein
MRFQSLVVVHRKRKPAGKKGPKRKNVYIVRNLLIGEEQFFFSREIL